MIARPPQITDHHLRRRAVAYIRQSSPEQVREHTGSTAIQRDLPLMLQEWGWAPEQIQLIDDDLGVSGSVPGLRQGFNGLIEQVESGTVGIVAVTDISRLGRNFLDLAGFVTAARRHSVLLAQGGQIVDYSDPNSEFVGMILGLNAVRENRARVQMGRQARVKKAREGHATTAPPVGYVRTSPGTWDQHPDPRVREAITLVFDKFMELGTEGRVIRWMRDQGLKLPRRAAGGQVRWTRPRRGDLIKILRNQAYTGAYIYGRTISQEPDGAGRTKVVSRPASDWIITDHHHPGYVTPERWADIQARLSANRSRRVAPAGRGEALVQGLLRCAQHGVPLRTAYYVNRRRHETAKKRYASYVCQPFMGESDSTYCCGMRADRVDVVVQEQILATLSPPSVDAIQQAAREALREHDALARGRQDEIRRVEQAVSEAERAYDQAPASRPHLKERLAQRLDDALRRRKEVESLHRLHPLVPPLSLSQAEMEELLSLLADLPAFWRHPAVGPEDRKRITRLLVKTIQVTPAPDGWTLNIEWTSGARTEHVIPNHRGVKSVIREACAAGLTNAEIVDRLREAGAVHCNGKLAGRPYDEHAISELVRRMKLRPPVDQAAYPIIAQRWNGGSTRQAIADELNAAGIRHRLGTWNTSRVALAVKRLQRGRGNEPGEVPLISALRPRVLALHDQGLSPREITERLRAEGALTWYRTPVTYGTVQAVFRHLKLRPHTAVDNDRTIALIKEWAPTCPPAEIAKRLNRLGLRTMRGDAWVTRSVKVKLRVLGIATPDGRRYTREDLSIIALVQERRAAGKTWSAIADQLNARGLRPRRAARWTVQTVASLIKKAEQAGVISGPADEDGAR